MNKDNFSLDELLRLAKATQSQKPEDMLGAVQNRIPNDKMSEIKKVLGDKKALEEILNSEQAKRIMRQFGKK